MTVRIPRTGQIRLSAHISASFNQDSGSQTHMNNMAVTYACHDTSTWSPSQRSMNSAHGVVTALMLNDRYTNTNYNQSLTNWPANPTTFNTIYNKQDTRPDGSLYKSSSQRAPSVESYGTHGHTLSAIVYAGAGAIYCNMNKKLNSSSNFNALYKMSQSDGVEGGSYETKCFAYAYGYPSGYLSGSRVTYTNRSTGIQTISTPYVYEQPVTIQPTAYPYVVFGYNGKVQYRSGPRIGTLKIRPHYVRLVATTGYA